MEIFHSKTNPRANDQFAKWRRNYPDGFVLSIQGRDEIRLHKAKCIHFDFKVPVDLAAKKKVCSLNRQEVEIWAKSNISSGLHICKTCDL